MPGVKRRRMKSPFRQIEVAWQTSIEDYVIKLAWSPDGQWLAAAAIEGPITLFNGATGEVVRILPGHDFGTTTLAWRPDGDLLASAGQDGHVRLWNPASGTEQAALAGGQTWVEHLAWSPQGDLLASAAGKVLRLWSSEGELRFETNDHNSTIAGLAWRPGGRDLATIAYGGVILRAAESPEKVRTFNWKGSSVALAWSPDGRFIATGDQDSTVHFWYSNSGQDLQMWGYPTKVRELSWHHTSRYLATGGGSTPVIWDCSGRGPEGTKPKTLEQHQHYLTMLAYQHNGSLLASAGQDGLVVIWEPEQRQRPMARHEFDSSVGQIAWSPHDKQLAVGEERGLVTMLTVN